MKRNGDFKKIISVAAALLFVLASPAAVFADTSALAYIKPDVTVRYNAEIMEFYDVNGEVVYPIIYQGTTYLPVRATASLMRENVEWRDTLKTIFIGKTLARPIKVELEGEMPYAKAVEQPAPPDLKPELVSLVVRRDFKVMFDFVEQTFKDANGEAVYPVVYNGSTYLPLRAISALMGEEIDWDGSIKTVYIGSKTPISKEEEKIYKVSDETLAIQAMFAKASESFNTATEHISMMGSVASYGDMAALAEKISADLELAQDLTSQAKALARTESFTDDEQAAADAVETFIELSEYYVLCMENIVYMALEGADFTIMQDAFEQYAYDTTIAFENARLAIEML